MDPPPHFEYGHLAGPVEPCRRESLEVSRSPVAALPPWALFGEVALVGSWTVYQRPPAMDGRFFMREVIRSWWAQCMSLDPRAPW
jgi:hypothetical protein